MSEGRNAGVHARQLLFACSVVVNLVAVYAPSDEGAGSLFPGADKLGHIVVFAAVAWTGRRAGVAAAVLGLALTAHAVTSELVQAAVLPQRSGDPRDVVADLLGAALGLWLTRTLHRAPQGLSGGVR